MVILVVFGYMCAVVDQYKCDANVKKTNYIFFGDFPKMEMHDDALLIHVWIRLDRCITNNMEIQFLNMEVGYALKHIPIVKHPGI